MATEILCPACKAPINYKDGSAPKFCENCGAKLDSLAAAPAADRKPAIEIEAKNLWIATGKEPVYMLPKMLNRHGLIAGATGTGKTVSIKVLSEAFSDMGVPVFLADIKGDVSGLCKTGEPNKRVEERAQSMNISDFAYKDYPVRFLTCTARTGFRYARQYPIWGLFCSRVSLI